MTKNFNDFASNFGNRHTKYIPKKKYTEISKNKTMWYEIETKQQQSTFSSRFHPSFYCICMFVGGRHYCRFTQYTVNIMYKTISSISTFQLCPNQWAVSL